MTPDWIVKVAVDRGPGHYYRYHVTGENLNHPEGHPDRRFSWSVPKIDDPRFDMTGAVWDNPTHKMADLQTGDLFRFPGSGPNVKPYVSRGNNWYDVPEGYCGGPWHEIATTPVIKL